MTDSPHSILDHAGLDRDRATALVAEALEGADDGELYLEHSRVRGAGLRQRPAEVGELRHEPGLRPARRRRRGGRLRPFRRDLRAGDPPRRRRGAGGQDRPYRHLCRGRRAAPTAKLYGDESPLGAPSFAEKVKLLEEIDAYARAKDPRVRQVTASLAGSRSVVEILRADGNLVRDVRPLVRVNVSVVVGDGDRQETGSHGMGGREGFERFVTADVVAVGRRRGAPPGAGQPLAPSPPRPAPSTSCSAPAGRASCCTRRSATGSRATSTARRRAPSPA